MGLFTALLTFNFLKIMLAQRVFFYFIFAMFYLGKQNFGFVGDLLLLLTYNFYKNSHFLKICCKV